MTTPYSDQTEVLRSLLATKPKAADLLIAIDGFSGSGKSTLSQILEQLDTRVIVVHMDDFYRPMPEDEGLKLSPAKGFSRYFDWERLRDQVLLPLSQSKREISYQVYDWTTKSLGRWEYFQSRGVVIIEGVYSTRAELRKFVDCSIFVDTSESVRQTRMEARQQDAVAWRDKWLAAERYYNEQESPSNHATLILRGE